MDISNNQIEENKEISKSPEEKIISLLSVLNEKHIQEIFKQINLLIKQAEHLAIENFKLKLERENDYKSEKQLEKEMIKDLLQ